MQESQILEHIRHMDIYLLDQILKQRYHKNDRILDAGCGEGRNLKWFSNFDYDIWGVDMDAERLKQARQNYPEIKERLIQAELSDLPFPESHFEQIICNAVLHFAEGEQQFYTMFSELIKVLKPGGTILIRTASNIGLPESNPDLTDAVSNRKASYYLSRQIISEVIDRHKLRLLEPVKTTNVQDMRCMTTLVLQK